MPSHALPTGFAGGRYQVKALLGEGGSKRVYLAYDARLEREVAVAVIRTEGLDEAGLARVRREAQAMARLGDHPHIVSIHDVGDEGVQPYIVSQYMAGGSLDDLLLRAETHRLAIAEVLRITDQICQALEHAHAQGIIHRDVKPSNVWLTRDGTAKLGDFGLAVALDRSRLTVEGMMVGTVAYMPPEQALGGAPGCPERPLFPRRDALRDGDRPAALPRGRCDGHRAAHQRAARGAVAARPCGAPRSRGTHPPPARQDARGAAGKRHRGVRGAGGDLLACTGSCRSGCP